MNHATIIMALFVWTMIWAPSTCFGQSTSDRNPLRSGNSELDRQRDQSVNNNGQDGRRHQPLDYGQIPPEVWGAIYPDRQSPFFAENHDELSPVYAPQDASYTNVQPANYVIPSDARSSVTSVHRDVGQPAGPTLADLLAESNRELHNHRQGGSPGSSPNDTQSFKNRVGPHDLDWSATFKHIMTNTSGVLVLAVGFLLIARFWMRRSAKLGASAATRSEKALATAKIQVLARLKLNAKAYLQLIEVDRQRVLVASDLTGIKSIVPLPEPFANALDQYSLDGRENDPTIDDEHVTYSPTGQPAESNRRATTTTPLTRSTQAPAPRAIEMEMKRRLAELLGGEAFQDVFGRETRGAS